MNPNAQKLIDALRSGEFKQGKHTLHKGDTYCCLGVACELYRREHPESRWVSSPRYLHNGFGNHIFIVSERDTDISAMPNAVRVWLGFDENDGSFIDTYGEACNLIDMNDRGDSFTEIADLIESEPKGLFTLGVN